MIKTNLFVFRSGIIFISCLLFFIQSVIGVENSSQITILEQKGEIYQQLNDDFIPLGEDPVEFQRIRVGDPIEISHFIENPQKVQEHWSVFHLNRQMTIALSNGSTFQLSSESDNNLLPKLKLEGIAHIFLLSDKENQLLGIRINDTLIQSQKSYLYFNGSSQSFNLVVMAGEITLTGVMAEQSNQTSDAEAENPILIGEEAGFTKHDGEIIEQDDFSFNRKLFELSTIKGYESLGSYQKVGSLTFDQDMIGIVRYEKPMDIYRTPILMFQGDKIITGENQTANLSFLSKDDIKVSESSEFIVDEFQKKADKISFVFKGKIRAKIKKRSKKGLIRFKTATALIGVKGTDFEAIASESSSEVATVEGLVGVSDPSGGGEVDVAEGMMTTVAAGELPKEPVPIPPERLKQLKLTGVLAGTTLVDLKNITLKPETAYNKPILNFQTVPADALFEVYLDQKLLENFKLNQPLVGLQDGKHQLEIKGLGEQPFTKSIQFLVDTKPPLIERGEGEEKVWELIEKAPLKLTWNEMIASVEIVIAQTKVVGSVEKDQKSALFTFDTIPDFFKKAAEHNASVVAMDKAGNRQELSIKLTVLNSNQPKLSIDHQSTELRWVQSQDISIQSDQVIKNWEVQLDGIVLDFMNEKADLIQDRLLKIPKLLLNEKPDGQYHLNIKAENEAGKFGKLLLSVILDRTKPKILKVSPMAKLEDLRLTEGSSITIKFSEKIIRLSAKIKNEKWDLLPEPDGLSVIIKANKLLSDESQPYFIQFYDQSNHFGEIYGQIQMETKKAVTKAEIKIDQKIRNSKSLLKKAYLNTILLKSNTLIDQTIIVNRLAFYYNNSQIFSNSMEGLEESGIQFKHNRNWIKDR